MVVDGLIGGGFDMGCSAVGLMGLIWEVGGAG